MISTVNPETSTIGTVARKRRRQILLSQRTKPSDEENMPVSKKPCVEPITSTSTDDSKSTMTAKNAVAKSKKPQMRYDPDVPMSKEEAAAWRKEQRRKRNRESAAASRQRQRDRIAELEQEVSEWKVKYEDALARIERMEQLKQGASMRSVTTHLAPVASASVSPCSSPRISPTQASDQSCGVVSLQEQGLGMEMDGSTSVSCDDEQTMDNHVKHLSEKISRPA